MLSLVFREKEISAEQPNKEILAHVSGGRSQVAHT
jgi:hypothetical protein